MPDRPWRPAAVMTEPRSDLDLLRAFEPVVRYTNGELFFPTGVEQLPGRVRPAGGAVGARAARPGPAGRADAGVAGHLHRAARREPLPAARPEAAQRPRAAPLAQPARPRAASARPAGWRASGSSRGSSTPASRLRCCCAARCPAARRQRPRSSTSRARERDPRYVYHGRVVRENGWICLHYLYFYFMNDYRSTFNGVNDHEADWEQVFIYLEETPRGPGAGLDRGGRPRLQRRRAAPTLGRPDAREGRRPPRHQRRAPARTPPTSSAASTSPRCPSRPSGGWAASSTWCASSGATRCASPTPATCGRRSRARSACPSSTTPAVTASPSGRASRTPGRAVLIDDATDWVDGYRGLFGLDTYDRFAGERAPAGPEVRAARARSASPGTTRSGFAGLDKMAPPSRQPAEIGERIDGPRGGGRRGRGRGGPPHRRAARPHPRGPGPVGVGLHGRAPSRLGRWSSRRARGSWPALKCEAGGHRRHDRSAPP